MPEAVPLAINGTIADISIDADGTIYVLESTGGKEGNALLRTFDRGGDARGVRAIADRASQVRIGTSGAVVHQSSSAQWTPVDVEGQLDDDLRAAEWS